MPPLSTLPHSRLLHCGRMKFAGSFNSSAAAVICLFTLQIITSITCFSLQDDPTAGPISTALKSNYFGVSFTSKSYRAFEGSAAVLTCVFSEDHDPACVSSPPTGTIQKLTRLNSIKSNYNEGEESLRQWTLDIVNVSRSDAGFYQCLVKCGSKMWTAVTRLRVDVQYNEPTTSWWRAENGSLTVSCASSGFPRGLFEWLNSTGLTTETATIHNKLWHLNSTMFIPQPNPEVSAYYCILTVWGSGDFELGRVDVKTQSSDEPTSSPSSRSVERREADEDDPEDSEDFTVPLILILVLCFIFLGLLLRCLCTIWPCLCCCRIPMM